MLAITVGIAVAVAVDTYVVTMATVDSNSMAPALVAGERVVINRLDTVDRGDIVAFDGRGSFLPSVHPEVVYVKRVIGVGGDRVACCVNGQLVLNGQPMDEPYLAPRTSEDVSFDVIVPDGALWVMGDNRPHSADSRAHLGDPGGGFVPLTRVEGTVTAVIWPLASARVVR
ncbi:MAG: signal peptidase I [Candidatus Nanopelagicales bacterium]